MGKIIKLEKGNIHSVLHEAKEVVKQKGVIIYPTDTVYGIGGDATEPEVVERIRGIKGIEDNKPFSVIMSDLNMIEEYCEVDLWQELILKKYLPGPYTFILTLSRPLPVTDNLTVGVRIPEFDFCDQLSEAVGKPIISTSANHTKKEPPKSFSEIENEVIEKVDLAIDAGPTKYSAPSAVVDLVNKKIIRKGIGTIDITKLEF